MVYRTEITSDSMASDNPLHQRQLYAYVKAQDYVRGNLLDIGCGEGRGIEYLQEKAEHYTGVDKNTEILSRLSKKYPKSDFLEMDIPHFERFPDESIDTITTFQVIEHIEDDEKFVRETARMLKNDGTLVLSTPNIKMTLTRNPWHVREYTVEELKTLMSKYFKHVECYGIFGDKEVMDYYEENKRGVKKFTRFDIFNLQYRLPRSWLVVPYNIANRMNRNMIHKKADSLVENIGLDNYSLKAATDSCFDLFFVARKS